MKTYIGFSNDEKIRFKATSGGIGTSIIKYLFESSQIQTSVSFCFNAEELIYTPQLIYSYNDYKSTGSIYHEVDLVGFLRMNIDKIQGAFACFCLPCQSKVVKKIVEKAGHPCIVIGLTCSSQQKIDATHYLLQRMKIKKEDVTYLQYRGNGWPSGIQIHTKDGNYVFVPNAPSLWSQIFHSRLFIRKKCFYCKNTLNTYSDIALADPWLPIYMKEEKIGQTIVTAMSGLGETIINAAKEKMYIVIDEISVSELISSQKNTIDRKKQNLFHKNRTELIFRLFQNKWYRSIMMLSVFWSIHMHLKQAIERFSK